MYSGVGTYLGSTLARLQEGVPVDEFKVVASIVDCMPLYIICRRLLMTEGEVGKV